MNPVSTILVSVLPTIIVLSYARQAPSPELNLAMETIEELPDSIVQANKLNSWRQDKKITTQIEYLQASNKQITEHTQRLQENIEVVVSTLKQADKKKMPILFKELDTHLTTAAKKSDDVSLATSQAIQKLSQYQEKLEKGLKNMTDELKRVKDAQAGTVSKSLEKLEKQLKKMTDELERAKENQAGLAKQEFEIGIQDERESTVSLEIAQ